MPHPKPATLRVGLIQQTCTGVYQDNLDKSFAAIRQTAGDGAQLILLQELHTNLYFCQTEALANFDLAESIPGPTTQALAALAAELHIVIVGSVFERRAAGIYHNTAVVLDTDGRLAGSYRKMHIPDDPGYYEKYYFTPGEQGFLPIDTAVGRLGVLICWDQWFPEAARLMSLAGADLLLYPTAIGWDANDSKEEQTRQLEAWQITQRAHAISNGLPVLVCNRTGYEAAPGTETAGIHFWGSSFVAGPQGEILAAADSTEETVLCADLALQHNETVRRNWPYLRDRRIDAYQDLCKRYRDIH